MLHPLQHLHPRCGGAIAGIPFPSVPMAPTKVSHVTRTTVSSARCCPVKIKLSEWLSHVFLVFVFCFFWREELHFAFSLCLELPNGAVTIKRPFHILSPR